MSFAHPISPPLPPQSSQTLRRKHRRLFFLVSLGRPADQSARSTRPPRHGSERDADPRHKVADAGGLPRVPEGDVLAAGQRVQVRPPGQELPGGKRPSYRLLRFAQGE